ncbi:hypothetical protein MTP03_09340 [Tsukamurella sp. PLM1]|nr:hypothetical protein MTP03_09340 [Tsukamurella sp. PLM1]
MGELGDAVNRAARGAGRTDAIARAEAELSAARATAFDLLSVALSDPDTIRGRSGRGTVEHGGRYGVLPYRLPTPTPMPAPDRPTG